MHTFGISSLENKRWLMSAAKIDLERLEDFEQRAGVTFEGFFVQHDDFGASQFVGVKGLLKAKDGKSLPSDLKITAVLYGGDGAVRDVADERVSARKFHGFVPFNLTLQVPEKQAPAQVSIYPALD